MVKNNRKRLLVMLAVIGFVVLVLLTLTYFGLLSSRDRSVLSGKFKNFTHQNLDRKYLEYVPSGKVDQIVVGLHGFGDNARRFAYYTGLHNAVNDSTLVIYPQAASPTKAGILNGWNSGFCCGSGWVQGIDDAGFIVNLIDNLKQKYNSPEAKVYVAGFSNGAFMASRLATDYPEKFNAVAVVAGSIGTQKSRLEPKTPLPIIIMHGRKDNTVPFSGGQGATDPDFVWLSHAETVNTWREVNGVTAAVKEIVYDDDSHKWNDWRILNVWHRAPQASIEIAEFFGVSK